MAERPIRFYTEIILLTILSLVSATGWINFSTATLNSYYPDSIKAKFLFALGITILSITLLYLIFSNSTKNDKNHNDNIKKYIYKNQNGE